MGGLSGLNPQKKVGKYGVLSSYKKRSGTLEMRGISKINTASPAWPHPPKTAWKDSVGQPVKRQRNPGCQVVGRDKKQLPGPTPVKDYQEDLDISSETSETELSEAEIVSKVTESGCNTSADLEDDLEQTSHTPSSLKNTAQTAVVTLKHMTRSYSNGDLDTKSGRLSNTPPPENLMLLRILTPEFASRPCSTSPTGRRLPKPTLISKAFISAIGGKVIATEETLEKDRPWAPQYDEPDQSPTEPDSPLDLEKGGRPTKNKNTTPMMLNRFAKGDPRRKFYLRMKWRKKPAILYDQYLPRRSFFSCHDLVLRSAGYDPHTLQPSTRCTPSQQSESKPTESQKDRPKSLKRNTCVRKQSRSGRSSLALHKEDPIDDEYGEGELAVGYTPIIEYLKLVAKNPADYIALERSAGVEEGKVDSLVGVGKVFARAHHQFGPPEGLVARAAYELGSKFQNPLYAKYEKEESVKRIQKAPTVHKKKNLAYIHNIMRGMNASGASAGKEKDDPQRGGLTLMERRRVEAEVCVRRLTTRQLVRARDAALREMGETGSSIRQWWDSHKYCQYIRRRNTQEERDRDDLRGDATHK